MQLFPLTRLSLHVFIGHCFGDETGGNHLAGLPSKAKTNLKITIICIFYFPTSSYMHRKASESSNWLNKNVQLSSVSGL